jgi:hypothetical protein
MTPFKALYGHRCHTPLNWVELGCLRSCHYANKRCCPLTFTVGYHVYLCVSPMRGVKRFGIKDKFAPCYIGPFSILDKLGAMAYKLELPPSLVGVHDVIHISQLKKCLKAPTDVVVNDVAPLETDLSYPEHPVKLLGQ